MFIQDASKLKNVFKCKNLTYKYLSDKLPLLSMNDEWYFYANTEQLKKVLDDMPWYMKVVNKWNL